MSRFRRLFTKKRGKTGFTLVELLVTITIIGIISITTFAIMISAMNTFKKQQDIAEATETKDMICENLKEIIRKKSNVILTNDRVGPNPEVVYTENINKTKRYIVDEKLKKNHLLYSYNGRVYFIETNTRGRYQIDADNNPMDATEFDEGKETVFDDKIYNGYNVELRFKPMWTERRQKYCDLRIEIDVTDPKTGEVLVGATETFNLINIVNKGKEIERRVDTLVAEETSPLHDAYAFCFFA